MDLTPIPQFTKWPRRNLIAMLFVGQYVFTPLSTQGKWIACLLIGLIPGPDPQKGSMWNFSGHWDKLVGECFGCLILAYCIRLRLKAQKWGHFKSWQPSRSKRNPALLPRECMKILVPSQSTSSAVIPHKLYVLHRARDLPLIYVFISAFSLLAQGLPSFSPPFKTTKAELSCSNLNIDFLNLSHLYPLPSTFTSTHFSSGNFVAEQRFKPMLP